MLLENNYIHFQNLGSLGIPIKLLWYGKFCSHEGTIMEAA